nr:MAG TPA: hypothetical protein [Caudoviricetes sp.]
MLRRAGISPRLRCARPGSRRAAARSARSRPASHGTGFPGLPRSRKRPLQ